MPKSGTIDIARTIRNSWSTAGYQKIARSILGSKYDLSIVLVGDKRARALSLKHRGKDAKSNVLTFPLNDVSGEIFINIPRVKREAHTFGLSPQGYAKFLLIHGCLHLKGYAHGSTMEGTENKLVAKFNIR